MYIRLPAPGIHPAHVVFDSGCEPWHRTHTHTPSLSTRAHATPALVPSLPFNTTDNRSYAVGTVLHGLSFAPLTYVCRIRICNLRWTPDQLHHFLSSWALQIHRSKYGRSCPYLQSPPSTSRFGCTYQTWSGQKWPRLKTNYPNNCTAIICIPAGIEAHYGVAVPLERPKRLPC